MEKKAVLIEQKLNEIIKVINKLGKEENIDELQQSENQGKSKREVLM